MKILSLITEYNPLHNGHIYHIKKSKELVDPDVTIAIMSGNFTQRGELAIINKFDRAKEVIKHVDLVIELPLINAISYADDFAIGAIKMAMELGTTDICFGSESGDIDAFKEALKSEREVNQGELKSLIKSGISYPRAIESLTYNTLLSEPNNTLGISYLRAIETLGAGITPHTIKRKGSGFHDAHDAANDFQSATGLRKLLKNKEEQTAEKYMPYRLARKIITRGVVDNEIIFDTLKTIILRSTPDELKTIYTMTEGLENRLIEYIKQANTYEEFLTLIKTKRYTWTRLSRLLIYVLLNVTAYDVEERDLPTAVRVLAMNVTGQYYLSTLKGKQVFTNINKKTSTYFKDEIKATAIYNTLTGTTMNDFNTPVIIHRRV
ncbi:nucleotidyltransferase [Phocicoccus pinnipedialis]|uniref:tRNA(Met) cytidine acetate ligase n=1 Tax=Phocicoccus pinnipedialis TaxID=110845 RepID=A0A6V7RHN1_9BACL|nr:nucleotidyltransferase [Jeotgalicoccus pinnipedialis]MBP1939029.1 putative nucleotidyltransferase [Jeotgalicoccus pinnipedialis]CAD2077105.1 tRNA(Met) cytidine acetate ligase [Jeotgalicoccus pinnipedialis]